MLNALLTPLPTLSFKKRRGHSVGGVPEQRYQSIPVCVAARLPTRAQDVLVRRSWATCRGCWYGEYGPQEWSEEAREAGQGSSTGVGVFLPQLVVRTPQLFIMGAWTGERETGGWETRVPVRGVWGIIGGGCSRGLARGDGTLLCAQVHARESLSVQRPLGQGSGAPTSPFSPQDAHLSEVNAVCFGPNSSLLATGGTDRLIHLWNVVGGEGPSPVGQSSVFSPDPTLSLFFGGQRS